MEIYTARLILRRAREDDLDGLHAVFSRPEAMRYWSRPAHDDIAETRDWLAGMIAADPATSDDYILELDGRVVGKAGAWRLPEIGFILHPDLWRSGLMREALTALIPHLFARHPIDRLTAEADPRNAGSLGLLHGLGFHETHRAERTMQWGEEWCDSVYLALPRDVALARFGTPG
jgi:ribosomal-protein-alanine N-acetyltransferase